MICCLLLSSCAKPEINKAVTDAISHIGREYTPGPVGIAGEETGQNKAIERLNRVASWDQLCYLASVDSVPMTRLAAFICIMKRNPQYAKAIALDKIHERSVLWTESGCSEQKEPLSSIRIKLLQQQQTGGRWTVKDSLDVDSVVLWTPYCLHIDYQSWLLQKLKPGDTRLYNRLRTLFLQEHQLYALEAMARYHTDEARDYILMALNEKLPDMVDVDRAREIEDSLKYGPHPRLPISIVLNPDDIHLQWEGKPWDFDYNFPWRVHRVGLECVWLWPDPAFRKWFKETKEEVADYMSL